MVGEGADLQNVRQVDRHTCEAVSTQTGVNELGGRFWKRKLSDVGFNDDFPTTGNAEVKGVVGVRNDVANGLG